MEKREVRVIEGVECLQCSKCKEWKEFNGFHKEGKYKDGTQRYRSHCKECMKEYHKEHGKEYRKINKKKISEYKKEYDKVNKEYKKEYNKKYWKISTQESLNHTKKICSQNGLISDKLKDKGLYGIIYLFQNKINKRCYVGQTTTGLENRYSKDVIEGWIEDRKTFESTLLEEDIEKYGTEAFTCDIIDVGYCRFHLDKLEAYYIDKYKSFEEGYNNNRGNLITSDGLQEFKELIKEYGLEELVSKEAIEFFEKNLEEEIVCCF